MANSQDKSSKSDPSDKNAKQKLNEVKPSDTDRRSYRRADSADFSKPN
jgi:hypothetical protein